MHRIYYPQTHIKSSQIISITDASEVHHLVNVLRLKTGEKVSLFNGQGLQALGEIVSLSSKEAKINLLEIQNTQNALPFVTMACAIPKKSKFEFIIEKATELGVSEIIPLKTKRTEVHLKGERLEKKGSRFEKVAINAAKQCKRATIPQIHSMMSFESALDYLLAKSVVLMPSLTKERVPIFNALQKISPSQNIAFLIGPEGDFTPEEYALAHSRGCTPISLGSTILKVDTAALCTLSCITQFLSHE
jgi:16S rRNA (uracil1498-N3)-methyltransferase